MKKNLAYLLVIVALSACNQDTKQLENETDTVEIKNVKPSQIADVPWSAVVDSTTQKITMVQNPDVKDEELDINNVTEVLNRKYPEIKINKAQLRNDTAFVNINDATYLTQQMGNMGSEIFLAEATYSFTQISQIKFVNFSFKVGDHASPGTFNRSNFTFKKDSLLNK